MRTRNYYRMQRKKDQLKEERKIESKKIEDRRNKIIYSFNEIQDYGIYFLEHYNRNQICKKGA